MGEGGTVDLATVPWRVGRKVGRTIYAVMDGGFEPNGMPWTDDRLIGMMDTRELAAVAVASHNHLVSAHRAVARGMEDPQSGRVDG